MIKVKEKIRSKLINSYKKDKSRREENRERNDDYEKKENKNNDRNNEMEEIKRGKDGEIKNDRKYYRGKHKIAIY